MSTAPHPNRRLTRQQRRRLSWRVAQGASLERAAARAGVDAAGAEALLTCPDFRQLVADYRAMAALPADERLRRLVEAAFLVLEDAIARGDVRATLFIFKERLRGRDPVRQLADGVVRALERDRGRPAGAPATDPPQPPPTPEPTRRKAASGLDRAAWAAASDLRHDIMDEAEALAGTAAGPAESTAPATETAASLAPDELIERQRRAERHGRSYLDGIVWSAEDLRKIEDFRPILERHDVSEEQLLLIAREIERREFPNSDASPETGPVNPNAPNN